jgi:hypothetical protein
MPLFLVPVICFESCSDRRFVPVRHGRPPLKLELPLLLAVLASGHLCPRGKVLLCLHRQPRPYASARALARPVLNLATVFRLRQRAISSASAFDHLQISCRMSKRAWLSSSIPLYQYKKEQRGVIQTIWDV